MAGVKVLADEAESRAFTIEGITAGNYTIRVFAKNYATYVTTVTAVANTTVNVGTLTLKGGAKVSGTIRTTAGAKISQNDAKMVVAASRDFKNVVFGSINTNIATKEIDDYQVVGLDPGVVYYLALVNPDTNKVYVDYRSTAAVSETDIIEHSIVYFKKPPLFLTKAFKVANVPGLIVRHYLFPETDVDLTGISDSYTTTYDVYYILGFITQPVMESEIEDVISKSATNASGTLVPIALSDSRKELVAAYVPLGDDLTRGYFELAMTGLNADGVRGNETYRFYIGEDNRSEQIVNPMVGGEVSVGEGDETGMEMPAGFELENDGANANEVAITSGTKCIVTKVISETVGQSGSIRFAPKKYSSKAFSTIQAAPSSYPGELMSSIYDMQVRLVSGPLATLTQTSSVGIKIQLSSAAIAVANEEDLGLYHYNEATGGWEKEEGAVEIDWENLLLTSTVNHFSKYAVFAVAAAPAGNPVAANLDNVITYPNPYKAGRTDYDGALGVLGHVYFDNLTAKAKIKLFNIAGELVNTIDKDDATSGRYDWEMTNKDGKKLASGVYIYYITNPDNSSHKKIGKLAIIK